MARGRGREEGPVEGAARRYAARKVNKAVMLAFLAVFLGAGAATGYIVFHEGMLGKHWYVLAGADLAAAGVAAVILSRARKMSDLARQQPGAMTPVKWAAAMVAALLLGLLLGGQAT